jgi:tight adherence protein B
MTLLLGVLMATGLAVAFGPRSGGRSGDLVGRSARRERIARWRDDLTAAGLGRYTVPQVVAASMAAAVVTGVVTLSVSGSFVVSASFAIAAGSAPVVVIRHRAARHRAQLRSLWPDVIDSLASAVRAGLSLPESLIQLSVRGPQPLQAPFHRFADEYRVTGRFGQCLDHLKDDLADPVGDRVIESLRLARDVGGHDVGRLLRNLSTFLREDARTRGELESRQSWTVNAARLAVAAPWLMLALLSLRPEAVRAYDSAAGFVVVLTGAVVCVIAYRLMIRLARLPDDERVLR